MGHTRASTKFQKATTAQPAIQEPTHAQIEEHAYRRYLERGRVDGSDLHDWFAAESELRSRTEAFPTSA